MTGALWLNFNGRAPVLLQVCYGTWYGNKFEKTDYFNYYQAVWDYLVFLGAL